MDDKEVIYRLWRLLDNIDTYSDVAKSDDKLYRKLVEAEQKDRWLVLDQETVDDLYDKYYGKVAQLTE